MGYVQYVGAQNPHSETINIAGYQNFILDATPGEVLQLPDAVCSYLVSVEANWWVVANGWAPPPAGPQTGQIANVSSAYSVPTPPNQQVLANPTSAGFTVTVPDATKNAGQTITIKNVGTANTVVVEPQSGQTLDGSAAPVPLSPAQAIVVFSDGSANWRVVTSPTLPVSVPLGSLESLAVPLTGRARPPVEKGSSVPLFSNYSGTTRINFQALFNAHLIQVEYWNGYSNNGQEQVGANAVTMTAAIEYPAGTYYRITFGGNATVVHQPGVYLRSDPLDIDIPAGATFYVRTYYLPASSGSFNANYVLDSVNGDEWSLVTGTGGTDVTMGGTLVSNPATVFIPGPSNVIAAPYLSNGARTPQVVVGVLGGSVPHGWGDYPIDLGYIRRALGAQSPYTVGAGASQGNYPLYHAAFGGAQAQWDAQNAGRTRCRPLGRCNNVIVSQGGNDFIAGQTLAQVQASLIAIYNWVNARSARAVFGGTLGPNPTSTDGYATLANQTAATGDSARVALNTWMRAGCPMINGAAVAVGTAGAVTCPVYNATGQLVQAGSGSGHPLGLGGVIDTAACFESSLNSGLYSCGTPGPGPTPTIITDAVTTANGSGVTSASGGFANAQPGMLITIAGAGTAGGRYYGWIATVNSNTSITLSAEIPPDAHAGGNTTPTAVSGATCAYNIPCCPDAAGGPHPGPALHAVAAASIPTGAFIAS